MHTIETTGDPPKEEKAASFLAANSKVIYEQIDYHKLPQTQTKASGFFSKSRSKKHEEL